ncbi:hypothetical protein CNR22_19725 [Sphingobacteriaceae bacterium]|nr:hypothetical protein CNR22_19725 [Sphingobacteriaceae bacterium]
MEFAFIISIVLLILFALLGLYDGFYLHIFKYRLYENPASRKEHLTHTIRGALFPGILYFLYLRQDCAACFYIGMAFVLADIITLVFDAYLEKDSRDFMGGLPRWEYIIHLFVNGFHFASIAVLLIIKLNVTEHSIELRSDFSSVGNYPAFVWLVKNLIPGGILMSLLHLMVLFPSTAHYWNRFRSKIICC